MFKSQVTRVLALTAAIASLAAGFTTTAMAAGPKRSTFDASVASCFIPTNVYGGSGPTITSPSVTYTNPRASVRVRAFAIVVNTTTGDWISYQQLGNRRVARGAPTTFPATTLPLPERSTSNFFSAGIHVQLEVRYRGSLIRIWTGIPSAYDTYTNGAFFPTYTGRASSC